MTLSIGQLSNGLPGTQSVQSEIKECAGDGSTLVFSLGKPATDVTTVENWESGAWVEETETTAWSHSNDSTDCIITFVDGDEPTASVAAVDTVTFDTQANTVSGDFLKIYAQDGTAYAVAADLTGSDAEPTSTVWTALDAAVVAQADLSSATTAADVAAAFELAFDGITGLTAKIVTDDTAADGTMTFTNQTAGDSSDMEDYAADSAVDESSSITWAETTEGKTNTLKVTYTTGDITGLRNVLKSGL